MERNFQNSQGYKFESQLREAYGKVVYSYTTHEKAAERLCKLDGKLKTTLIVCSAISSTGFMVTIFGDTFLGSVIGGIFSLISILITTYQKSFNPSEQAQSHKTCALSLWRIRERYTTLLTDFEIIDENTLRAERDKLQDDTFSIYRNAPPTTQRDYSKAQKALKAEEEQTFSDLEIDNLLPSAIRRNNRTMKK